MRTQEFSGGGGVCFIANPSSLKQIFDSKWAEWIAISYISPREDTQEFIREGAHFCNILIIYTFV